MSIHICCEDCIHGMQKMQPECANLVIADPPYNIGVKNEAWDQIDDYLEFTKRWLSEATRILRKDGTLLLWGSPNKNYIFRISQMITDTFGLKFLQSLSWVYTTGGDGRLANMRLYATRHELLMWFSPSLTYTFNPEQVCDKYTEDEKKIAIAKGAGRLKTESLDKGRPPRSWFLEHRENSRSVERRHGNHPSMKPLPVCHRLIKAHSNEADLVVIPFMGSGSEVISSAMHGRRCIGFENNTSYMEIIEKRLSHHNIAFTRK